MVACAAWSTVIIDDEGVKAAILSVARRWRVIVQMVVNACSHALKKRIGIGLYHYILLMARQLMNKAGASFITARRMLNVALCVNFRHKSVFYRNH